MAEEYFAENQQPKPKKKKRRKKHYFLRFLVFVALVVGAAALLFSEVFNVEKFDITGNNYHTAAQVAEMSGLSTGVNMFKQGFGDARKALLEDPYIRSVKFKRVPLNTIAIAVEERVEYAALPYASQFVIIDDEGMVLRVVDAEPILPILEGMEIVTMEVGKPLEISQSYLLTDTLDLLKIMNEKDLYFKKIVFSNVTVKAYIYDELYCEGKPENITAQMGAVKKLAEEQYKQGIVRGVIKVGKDNYLSFSPVSY